MQFGNHIAKGIWGLADKTLPFIYGIGYVLLAIRSLPEVEFGNFVLLQEVFFILSGLSYAFALQPLLKYTSEENGDYRTISVSILMNLVFILLSSLAVIVFREPLSSVLNAPGLSSLFFFLPPMLLVAFIRSMSVTLLQARFQIKLIFWTDAVYFLGAPILIYILLRQGLFGSAEDLIMINIVTMLASSLVGLYFARPMILLAAMPDMITVKKMWEYGKYSFGGSVSFFVYAKADTFILSAFTGPVQVAVYNSVKVFTRVYDVCSQVIQIFVLPAVSKLSSQRNHDQVKAVIEKAIYFSTLSLLPIFFLFLAGSPYFIELLYHGKYLDSVVILQALSLLSFLVPGTAVAANALMGLGQAKKGFIIGMKVTIFSIIIYLALSYLWGLYGIVAGYITSSLVLFFLTMMGLNDLVPIKLSELLKRNKDVVNFIKTKIRRNK
jgi:O-antigen/teichoic acid export membrane protein